MSEESVLLHAGRERVAMRFIRAGHARLFASHHIPIAPKERAPAVVLCYPAGHEYERCHRAFRQLAVQLARAGLHVLRFDYRGTGDSSGEARDADLAAWRQDIGAVVEHLRAETQAERVALIGLRLGGTLALQVAAGRTDISHLVLWSPVVDGAALLREWAAMQREYEVALGYSGGSFPPSEVLGVPLSGAVVDGLLQSSALMYGCRVPSVQLIVHDAMDAYESMMNGLRVNAEVTTLQTPGVSPWRRNAMEPIVPAQVLQSIVAWISGPQ